MALGLVVAISVASLATEVVISEIAWSGTAASPSDEWIELYNTTATPVDLVGWRLVFGEITVQLSGIVGPEDYYLLERTDDESISDIEADLFYTGALANSGVAVELLDAEGNVVDRIDVSEAGWPAGTDGGGEPRYASMERVDPFAETAAWASNDGTIRNGSDIGGNPINGTPGAENSATILARVAPKVELIVPGEEGAILAGVIVIEWSAVDPDGPAEGLAIAIEISLDGGETWQTVVGNLANGGSYAWDTALHADSSEVKLRILAVDSDGYRGVAESPVFTIRNETD